MSQFFAQGSGSGGTRLHLTTSNDTGVAVGGPTAETIFHSQMPHVIVNYATSKGLSDGGEGYYVCVMPGEITDALSNDPTRVILTEITFADGSRHMLNGMSVGVGTKAGGLIGSQWPSGGQGFSTALGNYRVNICASADISFDCGYCFSGTSGGWSDKLRDGTGAMQIITGASGKGDRGPSPPVGPIIPPRADLIPTCGLVMYNSTYYTSTTPTNPTSTVTLPNEAVLHPGGRRRGYDSFYIRSDTVPMNCYGWNGPSVAGSNPINGSPTSNSISTGDGSTFIGQFVRANPNRQVYWNSDSDPGGSNYGRNDIVRGGITGSIPVSVTWYCTNLYYNYNGFNIDTSLFTGNEILISPSSFTIAGVNLSTTNWKFINYVVNNTNVANRPDMHAVGTNVSTYDPGLSNAATWTGAAMSNSVNQAFIAGGNQPNLMPNLLSIYNFLPSASWYVNTATSAIGNQWGDVWSPGNIPLRLLGSQAAATIGGNITFIGGTTNVNLATLGLQMNTSRGGPVVLTLDFDGAGWLGAGGIGGFNPMETFGNSNAIDSRPRIGGSNQNQYLHQILTLPLDQAVPFYRLNGIASVTNQSTSSYYSPLTFWTGPGGTGYYTITYYLVARSNGNVEVLVNNTMSGLSSMKVSLPPVRIAVQKLA